MKRITQINTNKECDDIQIYINLRIRVPYLDLLVNVRNYFEGI